MRWLALVAASIVSAAIGLAATAPAARVQASRNAAARAVIDNPQVRVFRTTAGSWAGLNHAPAVVIALEDAPGATAGTAIWVEDAATPAGVGEMKGAVVIVQPRRGSPPASRPAAAGSRPGDAPFTGMSFTTIFENDRVTTIRARMEVGAREGVHTHASDTVVVHLSGGEIEDTADGRTVVNRWKRGDVEFEGLGTSHSARNVGGAVDVVLVALKPR